MSTCNPLLQLQEQICYVQCGFCMTPLLVSVPCSSLAKTVRVRCGQCARLLSAKMAGSSSLATQLCAPIDQNDVTISHTIFTPLCNKGGGEPSKAPPQNEQTPLVISLDRGKTEKEYKDETLPLNPTINKPQEKRQRALTAYHHFMREEMQRLKSIDPHINHRQAFGTAAKNWALYPRFLRQLAGVSCSYGVRKVDKKPRSS